MNKQEAIKKTEELEKQLAELKAIIEAPETSELVFKPEDEEAYCIVNNTGGVGKDHFILGYVPDVSRVSIGNCFRTEEDAKNSAKYYIMNSDYDYWFPWSGQPKPKVLPKGLEFFWQDGMQWLKSETLKSELMEPSFVYRWKRELQV